MQQNGLHAQLLLHASSGTQICIPPAIFVDKHGQLVTGEVEITYVEYRDPIDFILSGWSSN